jgi:hypothetical protein
MVRVRVRVWLIVTVGMRVYAIRYRTSPLNALASIKVFAITISKFCVGTYGRGDPSRTLPQHCTRMRPRCCDQWPHPSSWLRASSVSETFRRPCIATSLRSRKITVAYVIRLNFLLLQNCITVFNLILLSLVKNRGVIDIISEKTEYF